MSKRFYGKQHVLGSITFVPETSWIYQERRDAWNSVTLYDSIPGQMFCSFKTHNLRGIR